MGIYALPVIPSNGNYDFGTTLDQVGYTIAMQWNTPDKAWYMSVFDASNNPIRTSIKIVLGVFLGRGCTHPLFLNGVFLARDMSEQKKEPGFHDMGTRVQLLYVPNVDLAKVLASG